MSSTETVARGTYSVIDGPDGAGKSSQIKRYLASLYEHGVRAEGIVEPGGTPLGVELRKLILDPAIEKSPESALDLFTAARRENLHQIMRPRILQGMHIVSDRGWYSGVAYQGFGDNMDRNLIIERSKSSLGEFFIPDASLILDVPVEVTEERLAKDGGKGDWFESKGTEFFERVRQGFLWLADEFSIPIVDGTRSEKEVQDEIFSLLGSVALDPTPK